MLTYKISLPPDFDGTEMSRVTQSVTPALVARVPSRIEFDFATLNFIRPVGIVFLHNLIRWLQEKKHEVAFKNYNREKKCISYLKDSQFFKLYGIDCCGTCRSTTQPLIDVKHEHSFQWRNVYMIPWLSRQADKSEASFYGLANAIGELFNNIKDHSRYDIGSVFCQHFPSRNEISIALADMGVGIPHNVKKLRPSLSDADAIVEATKERFTTKSIPTNAGMGLDQLMRAVVIALKGSVTIYSQNGMVKFVHNGGLVQPCPYASVGFSPGTMIEISLDTSSIPNLDDDEGDIKW